MPPVENLTPGAYTPGMNLNVSHFLSEESMSEPRILIYHEWLMNGIIATASLIGFGVFFKIMNPIPMPFMSFQKSIVDLNPFSTALCLS